MMMMTKWYSGTMGPKASWHLSYSWGKTPKKPHPGNLFRLGIEPRPASWQAHMLPPDPQQWTGTHAWKHTTSSLQKKKKIHTLNSLTLLLTVHCFPSGSIYRKDFEPDSSCGPCGIRGGHAGIGFGWSLCWTTRYWLPCVPEYGT